MKEIADNNNWRAMATFRLSHPLAELERRVDTMVGDRLLDLGLPALASLYYGRAVRQAGTVDPDLLAREIFSRVQAGELISLESVPDTPAQAGGSKQSLRRHLASWQPSSPATSAAEPKQLDLTASVVTRLPVLQATLPLREWQTRWEARAVVESDAPSFAEEFVPLIPVGDSNCLVLNMGDAVQAMNIADNRMLWTFLPPEHNAMTFPSQKYEPQKAFIECARARRPVVTGDRVYCHLAWGHHDTYRHAGALFALDRSDGRLLWSSRQLPELAELMIAGDPAVSRGVVVTLAWRLREALPLFFVVGLSAETGELLWLNHLCSGSSLVAYENQFFFDRPLANAAPVIADGVAYLCTGAGVIAAVDIMDGTTCWATSYPRLKAVNSAKWASRMTTSRPAGIVAVFKNLVLFAPVDSNVILAVDRSSGKTRYRREMLDLKAIAAADAERAYLVMGTTIRVIRPVDGQTVWERPLPVSGLVGLPTLGPRGLLCPSWEALYVLDAATGTVREQKSWSREDACDYLCDLGDRLAGGSQTGLNILAEQKLDEIDPAWLSPETDAKPVEIQVPSRADKWVRWGLPAVDRGDFVLSDDDPDHLLIRSKLLQMRDMEPVPTLRWQRQSPLPWGYEATFNRHWVAVWTLDDVYVLDAKTGRTLWQDHPNERMNRPIAGARIVERQVQVHLGWHSGRALSQTAPAFVLFDGQDAREVPGNDPSLLVATTGQRDGDEQDITYVFEARRIRAFDKDRRQLWQTLTLLDEPRLIKRMGRYVVVVTQDRTFRQNHLRNVSHLRVFDAASGESLNSIAFPKRWFHLVGHGNGRLLLWDCAFLYCISTPQTVPADRKMITIRQDRPDPDAVAALRMARDLEDPPAFEIPTLPSAPRVDADLSEWAGAEPRRWSGVMDWTPDFVHRCRTKARSYAGGEGCAADVRMGLFGEDLYVAVEVSDDIHCTSPAPGLWQSDSVSLIFGEPKEEEIDPFLLTVSLVTGVPRFELGTVVSTFAVSDPAGQDLVSNHGPRRLLLPALSVGVISLPRPAQSLEIAARRDETTRQTCYEFRVPRLLFRYGSDFYWDLFVNENDGAGRAGALQMASATWGTEETQIGSLRGRGK
ncbi:MAG: outer membrane protein assembly factor BamB family protein [Phycisphaerae bacterium]